MVAQLTKVLAFKPNVATQCSLCCLQFSLAVAIAIDSGNWQSILILILIAHVVVDDDDLARDLHEETS